MARGVTVCAHPLIQDKLAILRNRATKPEDFRAATEEIATLMGYEVFKGVRTRKVSVTTPLETASAVGLDQPVALVAVLRAGLGFLPGLLRLAPAARIGHIGLYRNEETLNPVRYYVRLPPDIGSCYTVLCDPMLATGGSAVEALRILKTDGAKQIVFMSLIASKAGIARVREAHPDVPVFTAGVDPRLNKKGYIVPGLGDAGDRMFAT